MQISVAVDPGVGLLSKHLSSSYRNAFTFSLKTGGEGKGSSSTARPLVSVARGLTEDNQRKGSDGKGPEMGLVSRSTPQRRRTQVVDTRRVAGPTAKSAASHLSTGSLKKSHSAQNLPTEGESHISITFEGAGSQSTQFRTPDAFSCEVANNGSTVFPPWSSQLCSVLYTLNYL